MSVLPSCMPVRTPKRWRGCAGVSKPIAILLPAISTLQLRWRCGASRARRRPQPRPDSRSIRASPSAAIATARKAIIPPTLPDGSASIAACAWPVCRRGESNADADNGPADITDKSIEPSLDHFVGAKQKRLRDVQAQFLGGLQIDEEFEPCRLLHRQISWLCTFEPLVEIFRPQSDHVRDVGSI